MASTTDPAAPNYSSPSAHKEDSPDTAARPSLSSVDNQSGTRRTSFNFLRRASGKSSSETRGSSASRSTSGAKMSRKQKALAQEEALRRQREASMLPTQPPRLPSHSALPQIATFGGEDTYRPDSVAIVSNKVGAYNPNAFNFSRPSIDPSKVARQPNMPTGPSPPLPADVDPYPRTESMTNRGRYSYASTQATNVNSPRRVRRRKDPTPFKYVTTISSLALANHASASLLLAQRAPASPPSSSFCAPPSRFPLVSDRAPRLRLRLPLAVMIHPSPRSFSRPKSTAREWASPSGTPRASKRTLLTSNCL